jgi:hypothetical protein
LWRDDEPQRRLGHVPDDRLARSVQDTDFVPRETPEQTLLQFLNAVVDRSPFLLALVGQVSAEDPRVEGPSPRIKRNCGHFASGAEGIQCDTNEVGGPADIGGVTSW